MKRDVSGSVEDESSRTVGRDNVIEDRWSGFTELNAAMQCAISLHGNFASLHEAYGVLMEEVQELFDEIKKKSENRDMEAVCRESLQVAAVAMKLYCQFRGD